jgi:hypothetical protein
MSWRASAAAIAFSSKGLISSQDLLQVSQLDTPFICLCLVLEQLWMNNICYFFQTLYDAWASPVD